MISGNEPVKAVSYESNLLIIITQNFDNVWEVKKITRWKSHYEPFASIKGKFTSG